MEDKQVVPALVEVPFSGLHCNIASKLACREHGVVGDMRDAWPSARVRKNVSLIRTFHGFKGTVLFLSLFY